MLVSIVAGSNKTVAYIASGHQEFHLVYVGLENIDNPTRRAHGLGILPCAFLPIPKGMILSLTLFFDTQDSFILSRSAEANFPWISTILLSVISHVSYLHIYAPQACHDIPWGCSEPWWTLLPSNLLNWAIHCWLSRTGMVICNCQRLVSDISNSLRF